MVLKFLLETMKNSIYECFQNGGEENKPSKNYKKIKEFENQSHDIDTISFYIEYGLTLPEPFNNSEYIQQNERLYYTGILKALLYPLGSYQHGGKTIKKKCKTYRKTYRKKR